jgi:hypothetical protein
LEERGQQGQSTDTRGHGTAQQQRTETAPDEERGCGNEADVDKYYIMMGNRKKRNLI